MTGGRHMRSAKRLLLVGGLIALVGGSFTSVRLPAQQAPVKVTDPATVVLIVARDSNEIVYMNIKDNSIIGRTFLGNNVNPHMGMMSPDGRYRVTGGKRANKEYIID